MGRMGNCRRYPREMKKMCTLSCRYCKPGPKPDVGPTLAPGTCGKPTPMGSRIIGGEFAKKDAWPWQVAIYYMGQFMCGGSLLSPTWIMTAAHCVDGFDPVGYEIVLGQFNREDDVKPSEYFLAKRAFHHPDWMKPTPLNNDIALIELSKPAIFNRHVQPICLPKPSQANVPVGSECYITGWGQYKIGKSGPPSIKQKQAKLRVVSNEECSNMNTVNMGIPVTDKMVCAGLGPNHVESGCHGDSGGPFVCRANDGVWTLQGSVSWGSGECKTSQGYSVFARTNQFTDWIAQYVK